MAIFLFFLNHSISDTLKYHNFFLRIEIKQNKQQHYFLKAGRLKSLGMCFCVHKRMSTESMTLFTIA